MACQQVIRGAAAATSLLFTAPVTGVADVDSRGSWLSVSATVKAPCYSDFFIEGMSDQVRHSRESGHRAIKPAVWAQLDSVEAATLENPAWFDADVAEDRVPYLIGGRTKDVVR